jgi:hypothetical protein
MQSCGMRWLATAIEGGSLAPARCRFYPTRLLFILYPEESERFFQSVRRTHVIGFVLFTQLRIGGLTPIDY